MSLDHVRNSINTHLDTIESIEEERDSQRMGGLELSRIRLSGKINPDKLYAVVNELRRHYRQGSPRTDEQVEAYERAIDEAAVALQDHFGEQPTVDITFSRIEPLCK